MARAESKPNRLAQEASPYLLQHARNPVDWYPWGDEAFAAARQRNVPIFLSIGYSTCYWCHVMERESFENEAIAALMNELFVCVKVDREERPDVDDLYMAATIVMTGRGGWPMSVFLDPVSLRPFYCGTYFPAEPRHAGIPTFPKLLEAMSGVWKQQRDAAVEQAGKVADAVREQAASRVGGAELGQEPVAHAVSGLLRSFDRVHGGFGRAPKFPQPVFLDLLLDVRERAADDSTADAIDECLRRTLDAMALGGVRDQIGGGFHRYSVDEQWLVPHFEKMLYDNAQLASVYARAARQYGDAFYAGIARSTCDYVLREMTHERGGFFSAQDAEVDGREGLNYLWTKDEIGLALCPPEIAGVPGLAEVARSAADFATRVYGVDAGANFKDPHHPEEPARNVLFLAGRPEKLAAGFQLSPPDFEERLARIAAALREARAKRAQPHLDDKVLASWNGLMIGALATCAGVLGEARYVVAAGRAADFVLANLVKDGTLHRSWREGRLGPRGVLEDSACMVQGLLALARQLDGEAREARIAQARGLLEAARLAFFDAKTHAMFDTREHAPDLFVRARSTHDGAVPSAAGVMVNAMIDLAELSQQPSFAGQALAALDTYSGEIAENPVGVCNSVRALLRLLIASESGQLAPAGDHAAGTPASPLRPLRAADVRDHAAEEIRAQRAAREGKRGTIKHGTEVVEIFAGIDRIRVGPDEPGELSLVIQIAEGWHVSAADPGTSEAARRMIPFRVAIINGSGVAAYADYPEGTPLGVSSVGTVNAYSGTVELRVALERTGEWKGTPILCVMYQACSDHECLAATTVELDIAIDP